MGYLLYFCTVVLWYCTYNFFCQCEFGMQVVRRHYDYNIAAQLACYHGPAVLVRRLRDEVMGGLGRILVLHHRVSALYRIHEQIRCLYS